MVMMEKMILIISLINLLGVLVVAWLIFTRVSAQKNSDKNEKTTERLIWIEKELEKLMPKISNEFRENRREITEQMQLIQKTVDFRIKSLQDENTKKIEEMRQVVDEKLQASVEKRFNESFKTISQQLLQVYEGLGEMKNLATGVGDLKKVMEGVKTRGIYGETQLKNIIEDILSKDQYVENVITKHGTNDRVEFAVKMPGKEAEVLLPIDSKFPLENYSRLIAAYENGEKGDILKYQKALAADVKEQAKKIMTKYIDPPKTTSMAMLFLPTESLYAEVLRAGGVDEYIRQNYRVTIVSPSTLPVVLSGLLMGFHTLAIEQRSNEVWQILGAIKTQFSKFGDLLAATKKKLEESANKIGAAEVTSRQIERKLKNVAELSSDDSQKLLGEMGGFDD